MKPAEWMQLLTTKKCTVIGLGVSNLPLIDFLLARGVCVTARDQKNLERLGTVGDQLLQKGVRLVIGDNYLDGIDEEVIFRSPGVHPHTPEIAEAVARGVILSSEMELFLDLTPARVIGISGSDGKTTTTTLTHLILEAQAKKNGYGRVFVGGNIGEPLLPHLDEMTDKDIAVVELSSFQLYTMKHSVQIAAITNLSPNHLNWHSDMQDYVNAKTNLYLHEPNEHAVFNAENETTLALARERGGRLTYFSSKKSSYEEFELRDGERAVYVRDGVIRLWDGAREHSYFSPDKILLPGRHNLENYMTAIALTFGLADADTVEEIAQTFGGVEHRLELVRTLDGVKYYNSSIDSSPTRTAAALSALREKPIVICGGSDKGISFAPLAEVLCKRAKAVVLLGETKEKIRASLEEQGATLPVCEATTLAEAVEAARGLAQSGDTVLLSPACASFDMFDNFADRGRRFKDIVNQFQSKE